MSTTPMSVENNNNNNNGIVDNSKAAALPPPNKAYGPYTIYYLIKNDRMLKFEITFVEDNNIHDFKQSKACAEITPSFKCFYPPGKEMDVLDFGSILIESEAISRIKGLPRTEHNSVVVKTEKEIADFTDSKGNIEPMADLLEKNESGKGISFFEALAERKNKNYLVILVPDQLLLQLQQQQEEKKKSQSEMREGQGVVSQEQQRFISKLYELLEKRTSQISVVPQLLEIWEKMSLEGKYEAKQKVFSTTSK